MTIHTNYTQARLNLAKFLDRASQDRDVVIIQRRGKEDVALIAADELSSLLETIHLIRSPKNADRILSALERALNGEGQSSSMDKLRQEVGIDRDIP